MGEESRGNLEPAIPSGLEQVLALRSDTQDATERSGPFKTEYVPEESTDEHGRPVGRHRELLPSSWDLSETWGPSIEAGEEGGRRKGHRRERNDASRACKWNPEAAGPYHATLSSDRRTARYAGRANHPEDVGVVKADRPLPRRAASFYFEVTILDTPQDRSTTSATVGLAAPGFPRHRQLGSWARSWGYRGVDGRILEGPGEGEER